MIVYGISFIIFTVIISIFLKFAEADKNTKLKEFLPYGFLITIPFSIILLLPIHVVKEENYQEWVNSYVVEYIETLSGEKINIQAISEANEGKSFYENSEEERRFYTITYMIDGEKFAKYLHSEAKLSYTLNEGDTPYMVVKVIDKELPGDIDKGFYNPIIYLPKNYTLHYSN